tara:strand:+ start:488 stop:625 length:138 start_codon:yes stop_codon:yes gene_type:complete
VLLVLGVEEIIDRCRVERIEQHYREKEVSERSERALRKTRIRATE